MNSYIVIGNGLAGHRAAVSLRKLDPSASIRVFGEEPHLPYDRPPLSKDFLLRKMELEKLTLTDASRYQDLGIDHHRGIRVAGIDRQARTITTDAGEIFSYDRLLLATGSRPRRLPGMDSDKAIYLRTLDDALRLKEVLGTQGHVVIVGGGFIGLEVAAAAREAGCRVSVVEAAGTVLSRVLPRLVGEAMLRLHQKNGVEFFCGEMPRMTDWEEGGPISIGLSDREISAEAVVVGIGVLPNTELAAQAGLEVSDGILVDRHCRTFDPAIFAAGDVTAHPTGRNGTVRRIESWSVASKQPLVAAAGMTGSEAVFEEIPWLWTDQYGNNLQVLGDVESVEAFLLLGDMKDDKWVLITLDSQDEPTGVIAFNSGREISMMRRVLERGGEVPPDLAAQSRRVDGNGRLSKSASALRRA